jgi:hypothetical protein
VSDKAASRDDADAGRGFQQEGDFREVKEKHVPMSEIHLDGMSIFIKKDKESRSFVDYFFMCDVYEKDPRSKSRLICTGQRKGLFRVQKSDLNIELLFPMDLDVQGRCFNRAAGKIMSIYHTENNFPDNAQFVSG